jgi:hypothetical protein
MTHTLCILCKEESTSDGYCLSHRKGILERQVLYSEFREWIAQDQEFIKEEQEGNISKKFETFMYKSFYEIISQMNYIRELFEMSPQDLLIPKEKIALVYSSFHSVEYRQGKVDIYTIINDYYRCLSLTPKSLLKLKKHPNYNKIYNKERNEIET